MSCRARPETERHAPGASGAALPRLRLWAAGVLTCVAALLAALAPAWCEEKVRVEGIFDTEVWKTDDGSRLLSRNEGDTTAGARLRLWATAEFRPGLQGFALAEVEGGRAYGEGDTEIELEQAFVRYTFSAPRSLVIDAGRIVTPLGNFSRRYLSSINPLIGTPDSYSLLYPLALQVSGRLARFDYRAGLIDGPLVREGYVPEDPGRSFRPALAAGVTPIVGFRLGGYATRGPYLGPGIEALLPVGDGWKQFRQSVYGLDAQFSRGYFELNGDFARASYEAPGAARPTRGSVWFIEPKYTFTPRFFIALRYERNDYPFIAPLAPGVWLATTAEFSDLEVGAGYRFGPGTLLKISYRRDRWNVPDALAPMFPDGYALAAQLSYRFDVRSWVDRPL